MIQGLVLISLLTSQALARIHEGLHIPHQVASHSVLGKRELSLVCVTQLFNAPTELETHSRHGSTHDSGLKLALPSFAAWLLSNVLRVVFVCRVDDMDGKDERCGEGQKVGQSSYKEPEENIFRIKHSLS